MLRAIAAWFNVRRRLVALVFAGWVVIVVVGSGPAVDGDQWLTVPDLASALTTVMLLLGLLGLVMLIYMRPQAQSGQRARQRQSLFTLIATAALLLLFVLLFDPPASEEATEPVDVAITATVPDEATGSLDFAPPATPDYDVLFLVAVASVAIAVLLLSRRRSHGAAEPVIPEDGKLQADVDQVIAAATTHLRSESDPRMAVIVAYASLEEALAARGHHRDPAETPTEHLARALAVVPAVAGPAVELGRLYELARFSDYPISDAQRTIAADELSRARATLATPEATTS